MVYALILNLVTVDLVILQHSLIKQSHPLVTALLESLIVYGVQCTLTDRSIKEF